MALLLGTLFYSIFGLLDLFIFREEKYTLWLIRYGVVVPYIMLIYLLSFSKRFGRYYNALTASAILLAGFGIVTMILIAPSPYNALYYAGLILIFIYGYTFLPIGFVWASATGWLIVVAYEIAAIWSSEATISLLSNNFFFLGGNMIGMLASYSIETYSRQDFIKAYLLETEKQKVDTLNRELESRVVERTKQLIQANKEIRQEMQERREAEEKYLTLFTESKDAVVITTPGGSFVELNPAGIELFGYSSKEEMLKIDIARDIYLNPADRQKFRSLIDRQGHVIDFEIRCRKKNGEEIILLETATAVRDDAGKIVAYQGILRDITEKKELERQLFQSQKMQSIGLLAGGIAHDLNNVLTPITMAIQLLQDKLPDEQSQRLLETLESNANRGADVVRQVLTFARGADVEYSAIHPDQLITELIGIIQHTFPKTIEIVEEIADDLHAVRGNASQLHQVLLNLCVNARDALEEGGKLTIKAENMSVDKGYARKHHDAKPGEYVGISVIDNGTGMLPHIMERIFEPFFTTKEVGKGTGLGLSVIHSIVQRHAGFIEVESEVGLGSVFRVALPADSDPTASMVTEEKITVPQGEDELVLIVDDEESMRLLAKEILENYRYRAITAKDGRDAVTKYDEHKSEVRVVMTDMHMPGMDGPSTIRALREINPKVLIIAMSGLGPDETHFSGNIGDAVQASITKPFSAHDLLMIIKKVIQDSAAP